MGEIDLKNLDTVNASLFTRPKGPALTIKNDGIIFNAECIQGLDDAEYINIIMDRDRLQLYVIKCEENDDNALRWCNIYDEKKRPRKLSGKGFVDLLFRLVGWDIRNRYIVKGSLENINGIEAYRFRLKDAEAESDIRIKRIINLLKKVDGVIIPDDE